MEGEQFEEQMLTPELAAAAAAQAAGYLSARSAASQREAAPSVSAALSQARDQLRPAGAQKQSARPFEPQQAPFPAPAAVPTLQQQRAAMQQQQQPPPRTPVGAGALEGSKSRIPLPQAGLPTSSNAAAALGAGRADQRDLLELLWPATAHELQRTGSLSRLLAGASARRAAALLGGRSAHE